ncbi:MAG: diguanylate cyclase [Desulfovibrio sp.]|uniref:sensor domain-containing diguanylate cyclase n=1 Tax=Desulfovibrio sp. TaxID=885 RepID=UPI00135F08B0|nr:sensor domain-containing diguanylate cyclase [Desulfovibrio sp.]MTJ94173.1 diguanylate cyclase [Desulfovibrio sp.]
MSMQDNNDIFQWRIGADLTYQHVDAAKERLLELPAGSLAGAPLTRCMHPEDASLLTRALAADQRRRNLTGCTVRYVCPKGTHTVTSLSITPEYDERGNLTAYNGRERCIGAVDTHGEAPPVFEAAFSRSFMDLCIIDRELRLRAVNERYASLAGKPITRLLCTHMDEVDIPTRAEVAEAFRILDAGGTIPEKEVIRNGKDYVMSIYGLPDACGEIGSICVFLRDISLRKGLERRLEAANRKLEEMNVKDYLTGVFNRRHFDETLLKEVGRLAREGGVMCVAMVDVDNFKLYNDAYGHLAGDACLARVAKAMGAALLRPADELFRYGGEEFAVIMPQTGREQALGVAERVREAVADLRVPHCKSGFGFVTISIGVAAIDAVNAHFGQNACEELIRVADKALYRAKNGGRNKIDSGQCSLDEAN